MNKDFETIKAAMADYIYNHFAISLITSVKGYDDDLYEWIDDYTSGCARAWMTIGGARWNG